MHPSTQGVIPLRSILPWAMRRLPLQGAHISLDAPKAVCETCFAQKVYLSHTRTKNRVFRAQNSNRLKP